jgi:hypothetical protein
LTKAKPVQLDESRLVELYGKACPYSIDVVGGLSGRDCHGYNYIEAQVKDASDRVHCGSDCPRLRPLWCRDIVGWCPFIGGAQLIHVREREDDRRRATRKLRLRPGAERIKALPID